MSSIEEVINHYQTSINKSLNDTARIVHCIGKLYKLPISVRHLQETGIGRTVNSLRKYDGEVGVAAKALVTKWKAMVASEESDDGATGSGQHRGSIDPGETHNGDRPNRSDMSDEEEEGGGGGGEDDDDDDDDDDDHGGDHDSAMVDEDDDQDDDVTNGSHAAEEEESYARSQLRDVGTQSTSESEDESDDQTNHQSNHHHNHHHHQQQQQQQQQPQQHHHHHHQSKSLEDRPSSSHWNEHHRSSSGIKEQSSGSSNHHNHHSVSASKHSGSGSGAHSHSTSGSSGRSEADHRRHGSSEGRGSGESKSHKSSSSRGEGSSSRKSSSHGDSDRHRERSSSKHHTTSAGGGTGELSAGGASGHSNSSSSSSARKDSSHKDSRHHRSTEEVDKGSGSSKRHAHEATDESASKRSRKEHSGSSTAVEASPSSSHSKRSSKASSATATPSASSSSKHRDRHEKSGERRSKKGSGDSSRSKSKRKEKVPAPSSSQEEGNDESEGEEDVADGLDGSGGASFADALAMIGMPGTGAKKKSSSSGGTSGKEKERVTVTKHSPPSSSSTSGGHSSKARQGEGTSSSFATPAGGSSSSSRAIPSASELLSQKVKLEPLPEASEIVEALPMISPHYRPMPLNQTVMDCVFMGGGQGGRGGGQRRPLTEEEALGQSMQSKNLRTKVYSGMKTNAKGVIPTLYELCIRLLQDHLDEIGATGGIPFYILKPVLERANPNQLLHLEHFNPHFVEDSDVLWEQHCKRTFRAKQRNEEDMETWREMFLRCSEERDAKLKSLTQNIKLAQEQAAAPVRKTQLAYVDSAVKPPRSVINKQARYGTARAPVVSPAARVAALKAGNVAQVGDARLRVAPGARDNAQAQVFQPTKPRKAPMMAKVLSSMKGFKTSFRR